MTVAEAAARYVKARNEFIAASYALQLATKMDMASVVRECGARVRRHTWEEADAMAANVRKLRAERPRASQREIGNALGISRDMVSYYSRSQKHFAHA